jgi:hypothetical protein
MQPAGARPTVMRGTEGGSMASFAASSAAVMTKRTRARATRSARSSAVSSVVAGTTTAPSFIAASMTSHSGATLPSMRRMRSPRLTPRARRPLATRFDRSAISRKVKRAAPAPVMIRAGWSRSGPAASSASNQSSAQLKSGSSGQRKPA